MQVSDADFTCIGPSSMSIPPDDYLPRPTVISPDIDCTGVTLSSHHMNPGNKQTDCARCRAGESVSTNTLFTVMHANCKPAKCIEGI